MPLYCHHDADYVENGLLWNYTDDGDTYTDDYVHGWLRTRMITYTDDYVHGWLRTRIITYTDDYVHGSLRTRIITYTDDYVHGSLRTQIITYTDDGDNLIRVRMNAIKILNYYLHSWRWHAETFSTCPEKNNNYIPTVKCKVSI